MANVSPDMFLTKICMVLTGSGEADLEIGDEETILIVLDGVRDRVIKDEASDLVRCDEIRRMPRWVLVKAWRLRSDELDFEYCRGYLEDRCLVLRPRDEVCGERWVQDTSQVFIRREIGRESGRTW